MAIHAPDWDADTLSGDWASRRTDRLRQDLADEALAIWRAFARSAGLAVLDAETATDAWVHSARRAAPRLDRIVGCAEAAGVRVAVATDDRNANVLTGL